jgi:tRNA pseudouridine38-40 synthase
MHHAYLALISYEGHNHYGFVRQKNLPSIEGDLKHFFQTHFSGSFRFFPASRTDRGVSAKKQLVKIMHESDTQLNFMELKSKKLPPHLQILDFLDCPPKLDVIKAIKKKHYVYRFSNRDVLENNNIFILTEMLDQHDMSTAAELFIGHHNFKNYAHDALTYESPMRQILQCSLTCCDGVFELHVVGESFMRHMVRLISGAVINVGQGKLSHTDIVQSFHAPSFQKFLVPGKGLTLENIWFEDSLAVHFHSKS